MASLFFRFCELFFTKCLKNTFLIVKIVIFLYCKRFQHLNIKYVKIKKQKKTNVNMGGNT